MDKTSIKSRGIPAFGISMVFGGLALLLSVAILGFGTPSASANGAQGPLAQGTQPIPQLTSTPTKVATREPTETAGATTTVVSTGTVIATTTAVSTAVSTGTVVGTTATVAVTGTAVSTATTGAIPTTEVLPTEGTGMVETSTPISVGMPRTGTPVGGSDLTLILLIIGVMITIGFASLATRRSSYRR